MENHQFFIGTVRALSRINFVAFGHLVGVELPRGIASIFVVPCKIGYRNHSKYLSFSFFSGLFLAEPVVMNCQEIFVLLILTGRNRSVYGLDVNHLGDFP